MAQALAAAGLLSVGMSLVRRSSSPCGPNPLLSRNATGFPLWDQIRPEHVKPAMEKLLAEVECRLADLEKTVIDNPTWEGLIEPYERLSDDLERAWGQVSHLKSVKDTEVPSRTCLLYILYTKLSIYCPLSHVVLLIRQISSSQPPPAVGHL